MRYEKYEKEIEEFVATPLPLGQEWVRVPVRNAKQYIECQKHHIPMQSYSVNGHEFWYICVKFEDIINIFD